MTPSDLRAASKLVYDKCGYKYTPALMEAESLEYAACDFQMNEYRFIYYQYQR